MEKTTVLLMESQSRLHGLTDFSGRTAGLTQSALLLQRCLQTVSFSFVIQYLYSTNPLVGVLRYTRGMASGQWAHPRLGREAQASQ